MDLTEKMPLAVKNHLVVSGSSKRTTSTHKFLIDSHGSRFLAHNVLIKCITIPTIIYHLTHMNILIKKYHKMWDSLYLSVCDAPRQTLQKTSIFFVINRVFLLVLALLFLHCIMSSCHHVINF